jgi:hypothetical protein
MEEGRSWLCFCPPRLCGGSEDLSRPTPTQPPILACGECPLTLFPGPSAESLSYCRSQTSPKHTPPSVQINCLLPRLPHHCDGTARGTGIICVTQGFYPHPPRNRDHSFLRSHPRPPQHSCPPDNPCFWERPPRSGLPGSSPRSPSQSDPGVVLSLSLGQGRPHDPVRPITLEERSQPSALRTLSFLPRLLTAVLPPRDRVSETICLGLTLNRKPPDLCLLSN